MVRIVVKYVCGEYVCVSQSNFGLKEIWIFALNKKWMKLHQRGEIDGVPPSPGEAKKVPRGVCC